MFQRKVDVFSPIYLQPPIADALALFEATFNSIVSKIIITH